MNKNNLFNGMPPILPDRETMRYLEARRKDESLPASAFYEKLASWINR